MRTLVASHVCADALRRQPARLRSSPDWISLPMLIHSGISYDAGGGTGKPSGACLKTADGQFREAELIRKTVDISRWSDQQP